MLQPPVWRIGDWFVIQQSSLAQVMVSDERLPWSEPFTIKASVIREEEVLGYPCFVLKASASFPDETWEFLYYFRQKDMNLLKYHLAVHNRFGVRETDTLGAPGPWGRNDILFLGAYPMFSVMSGEQVGETELKTKAGELVVPMVLPTSWRTYGMRQAARQEAAKIGDKKLDVVRVEIYNKDNPNNVDIMRWLPGKIWWAQCWSERLSRRRGKYMNYRASLAATSLDVVPADEMSKVLSSHIGEWKMQIPRLMDLPDHLWHLLSNYRRMQTVAYQNKTGKQLLLWVFPNPFDEDRIAEYEKMSAAERGAKGWPNLLAQGENYRLYTAIVPQQEGVEQVLEDIKQAVAQYPKVTLEEYPLLKAGRGGKILEQ